MVEDVTQRTCTRFPVSKDPEHSQCASEAVQSTQNGTTTNACCERRLFADLLN